MIRVGGERRTDLGQHFEILFSTEALQIEFRRGGGARLGLAFVFSALGNRVLSGDIAGGDFLLDAGFDVVNVNSIRNDWFQSLPEAAFEAVQQRIGASAYDLRVGVGSSMGGFAAICFSRRLNCHRILAYSPQFDASPDFDARFAPATRNLAWRHKITADSISDHCDYCFVYDDRDYDAAHVAKLRALIKPEHVREIRLRHAGHATVYYLYEIARLKDTTLAGLLNKPISERALRSNRRQSRQYLRTIAERLAERRPKLALRILTLGGDQDTPPRILGWALRRRIPVLTWLAVCAEHVRLRRAGFDASFYRHVNWDIEIRGLDPIVHYIRSGRAEHRLIRFRAKREPTRRGNERER